MSLIKKCLLSLVILVVGLPAFAQSPTPSPSQSTGGYGSISNEPSDNSTIGSSGSQYSCTAEQLIILNNAVYTADLALQVALLAKKEANDAYNEFIKNHPLNSSTSSDALALAKALIKAMENAREAQATLDEAQLQRDNCVAYLSGYNHQGPTYVDQVLIFVGVGSNNSTLPSPTCDQIKLQLLGAEKSYAEATEILDAAFKHLDLLKEALDKAILATDPDAPARRIRLQAQIDIADQAVIDAVHNAAYAKVNLDKVKADLATCLANNEEEGPPPPPDAPAP